MKPETPDESPSWRPNALDADRHAASQEQVPSRRIVLRGMVAAGCSVLLPQALLGCQKKEAAPAGTAATPAAPGDTTSSMEQAAPAGETSSTQAAAPAASPKVSKASVQYQAEPKGDQKCATCMHFIPESNTCKLVEGDISPNGWCVLWAKKA